MATTKHSVMPAAANHGVIKWTPANSAARLLIVPLATDLWAQAYQVDTDELYILKQVSPSVVWRKVASTVSDPGASDAIALTTPFARWRADTTLTHTTTISSWADMVSSRVLSQSTPANEPTYTASVAALSSQPALSLDSNADGLVSADPASTWKFMHDGTGMELMIFMVSRINTSARCLLSTMATTTTASIGLYAGVAAFTPATQVFICEGSGGGARAITCNGPSGSPAVGTPVCLNISYKELASPEFRTAITGVADYTDSTALAPSASNPNNTLTLGAIGALVAMYADIAEIVIWNKVLTSPDRTSIAGYRTARYGY